MQNEVRLVGGTAAFERFLRDCLESGTTLTRFVNATAAVRAESATCRAYVILPDYDRGERIVPELDLETLKTFIALHETGQRLFIENYPAGDYLHSAVFGHLVDARERHFFTEYLLARGELADALPGGLVLQARGAYYFPGRAMGYHTRYGNGVLLEASDCIGTHRVFRDGTFRHPVLVRTGRFFCSAMNMTQVDRLTMLPHGRWRDLFAAVFAQVLNVPPERVRQAFSHHFPAIDTAHGSTLENAVAKAVRWHEHAGLLIDPSGTQGMFEMIRSYDLKVRSNIRTDAELITGLLYCTAGRHFDDERLTQTGMNLVRFLLDAGIQLEGGDLDGFFRWFLDLDAGPANVWSSDTSRAGLVVLNMHKLTGADEFLARARRLGDALLRWLGPEGLLCGSFQIERGFRHAQDPEHVTDNPVYYGEMTAFLTQLFRLSGETSYRDAVLKYATRIMDRFPNTKPFGYSDNFTYSRYLMMLACIQENLGVDESERINACLRFFSGLQHVSGGIRETPIRLSDHAEAGVGIGDGSDCIADMLYCNNFVLCALSIITKMEHPGAVDQALAGEMYRRLTSFVLDIQIDTGDRRLDGGWMRAFDMEHHEYYGLNKDKDWGAYCIMAGWVTGFIPLVLLNQLGAPSVFTVGTLAVPGT